MNTLSKIFSKLTLTTLAFSVIAAGLIVSPNVNAAGVAVTVTPSAAAVSTTGNIDLLFTTTNALPVGSKLTVLYPNTYTGTAAFTINGAAATPVISAIAATSQTQAVLTTAAIINPATAVTVSVSGLTKPSILGNYSFTVYTSKGDYGAVLQYVGDANVVQISAFVPLNLSFVIRDAADAANTNTCDMGMLSTSAIGSCSYRLKIGTNATSGYTVSVQTSGNFTNGTKNFTNAAAGSAGTLIAAGTEMYGVKASAGSITAPTPATMTLATPYSTSATNVVSYVNTAPALLATATGPNAPLVSADATNTMLIEHKAAINANTGAGLYTQTATYTVTAAF
jgi:hypothetical protein